MGAGLYFAKEQGYLDQFLGMPSIGSFAAKPDYDAVRKAVSELMENTPEDYDDGSYVRHNSEKLSVKLLFMTSQN